MPELKPLDIFEIHSCRSCPWAYTSEEAHKMYCDGSYNKENGDADPGWPRELPNKKGEHLQPPEWCPMRTHSRLVLLGKDV